MTEGVNYALLLSKDVLCDSIKYRNGLLCIFKLLVIIY